MGKWLKQLRDSSKTPEGETDRTDKTATGEVLSVLSGRSSDVGNIFALGHAASGSAVCPSAPYQQFHRHSWDEQDWQAAFDERAAILEFDAGLPREEAEALARREIERQRKRWMQ